ncbi:MAG: hypothetical protein IJB86_06255 [Clostridia bacterium]|nr:hypothetical protein [Clostridia bacterium]
MAKNKNRRGERLEEWLIKLLKGIGVGLLVFLFMLISGEFKGEGVGRTLLFVLGIMVYTIGFSFGFIVLKLAWRKFVARGRNISFFAALTGGGVGAFVFALLILIAGIVCAWVIGWVFCVVDIICAVQGRRLLSSIIEARYGDRTYEPADPGVVIEDAVRYNYQNHGTPDAGKTDHSRGYTPTEKQVYEQTQKKKQQMNYWE